MRLHPIVAQILVHRGLEQADQVQEFFQPGLRQLPDPSEFADMDRALSTLSKAVQTGSPILIHGDYDVDGTCGAALLMRLFRLLGHPVDVYLPDRIRDGYSFGKNSLEAIRHRGAQLVIAVDNGTTALEPLRQLQASGVDVLIVDHHQPGAELPPCAALLNPWCHDQADGEKKLFPYFCGAAVAFFLAWGFLRHWRGEQRLPERDRRFLMDALALVAVATVADVMPLTGPNRSLVHHGLRILPECGFPGLRALAKQCRLRPPLKAEDFGFRLCPRLNAAGRLGKTKMALDLLTTADPREAETLAQALEGLNQRRREIEQAEMERLMPAARKAVKDGQQALFLGHEDAHFGVLGVVANRLLDETGLPTLLWSRCMPEVARGSARAPAGSNLLQLLEPAADHLLGYGGHRQAAGFSFRPGCEQAIAEQIERQAAKLGPRQAPELELDLETTPGELTMQVAQGLESLAPFGAGNPAPKMLSCGLRLAESPRRLGDGSHASLWLESQGHSVRVLAWRMADRLADLPAGTTLDVVFTPGLNEFRGRTRLEWTLIDFRSNQQP